MIQIKSAENEAELLGILTLQEANLFQHLDEQEKAAQGFVTVKHSLDQLRAMNDIAAHVIATEDGKVVGYILAMTKASRAKIPVLVPMFEQFDQLSFQGRSISDQDYLVVGQICVGKPYRGQGLFDRMYDVYRDTYAKTYAFVLTEIATSNTRSLQAHSRVGFQAIHRFRDSLQEWEIVFWDWESPKSRSEKDS
jgi:GNAT superfamily N-acetyltransferase